MGGEDRGERGPKRPDCGAGGGIAGARDVGDEERDECNRLHEPEPELGPSLFCTTITGNDAAGLVLVSCAGSVSVVIVVWRLVLACMSGANSSSLAAEPLLEEDDDDDDGDGGWVGNVGTPSWDFRAAGDPALPRLLEGDGDDGDREREVRGPS